MQECVIKDHNVPLPLWVVAVFLRRRRVRGRSSSSGGGGSGGSGSSSSSSTTTTAAAAAAAGCSGGGVSGLSGLSRGGGSESKLLALGPLGPPLPDHARHADRRLDVDHDAGQLHLPRLRPLVVDALVRVAHLHTTHTHARTRARAHTRTKKHNIKMNADGTHAHDATMVTREE
jgi:hypothetical protein